MENLENDSNDLDISSLVQLIESNKQANSVTEKANAISKSLSFSTDTEVVGITTFLLKLSSDSFEEYISSIRIIRSLSAAKNIQDNNPKFVNSFVSKEKPTKKATVKPSSEHKLKLEKAVEELKNYLADGPKPAYKCLELLYFHSYDIPCLRSKMSDSVISMFYTLVIPFVTKKQGLWYLKS